MATEMVLVSRRIQPQPQPDSSEDDQDAVPLSQHQKRSKAEWTGTWRARHDRQSKTQGGGASTRPASTKPANSRTLRSMLTLQHPPSLYNPPPPCITLQYCSNTLQHPPIPPPSPSGAIISVPVHKRPLYHCLDYHHTIPLTSVDGEHQYTGSCLCPLFHAQLSCLLCFQVTSAAYLLSTICSSSLGMLFTTTSRVWIGWRILLC